MHACMHGRTRHEPTHQRSGFKPFVMLAVTEGDEAKESIPPDGVRGLKRATDVAVSSTSEGKDYEEKAKGGLLGGGKVSGTFSRAVWPKNRNKKDQLKQKKEQKEQKGAGEESGERFYLYVKVSAAK